MSNVIFFFEGDDNFSSSMCFKQWICVGSPSVKPNASQLSVLGCGEAPELIVLLN